MALSITTTSSALISGTANPRDVVHVTITGGTELTVTANDTGTWTAPLPSLLPSGRYTATATVGEQTISSGFVVDLPPQPLPLWPLAIVAGLLWFMSRKKKS